MLRIIVHNCTDSSVAQKAMLPVLGKLVSLIEALRFGSPYDFVHRLWSQFTLTADRVNVDVTWFRNVVLVGNLLVPSFNVFMYVVLLALSFRRPR